MSDWITYVAFPVLKLEALPIWLKVLGSVITVGVIFYTMNRIGGQI